MTDHTYTPPATVLAAFQARPAEVTDEMRRAAASAYEDMAQVTRPENHEKCLNAALEAAIAIAPTPAAAFNSALEAATTKETTDD